ncbi:MAG: GDP-mannose 4,6-dehydratase [Bacteriovorax sp.]|nr:GDP-mannose 4,6-dehydratase [Bacteriovorax sp.]
MKTALICGVSGQDGAFLTDFLLKKNYQIIGTSRDAQVGYFGNLKKLGLFEKIKLASMAPNDFRSVLEVLKKHRPDEIYFLAGQSSVGLSFEQPMETLESISVGCLNILEAIRFLELKTKFYNAGSSECFGDTLGKGSDLSTPFTPRSPYAVAKSTAHWLTANYRESYGLFACTGVLFNHESYLRPERFVTQKIISAVVRISQGSTEKLSLGNINISRDWGWAPEYVEAMWLMLQNKKAEDFIICTGETNTLETFVKFAFEHFNLNYKDYMIINEDFIRPNEILVSYGDPKKAFETLGWKAQTKIKDIIVKMIEYKKQ